jgi:RNA polymerase sigma-70 factor (ECF subfamily)
MGNISQRNMNKSRSQPSNMTHEPSGSIAPDAMMKDSDDDYRLVALAQGGDMSSYDELVTRHRGKIFAMIRNMIHQEADAWDLSQEVFIKAWRALPRFEAKAKFSTWLYRIAHNVVYDWMRKRKIEGVGEFDDGIFERERIDSASFTTPSGGELPDVILSNSELRVKMEIALGKLSAEHREVVLLKDAQGLSYKEIAEAMSSSMGTVMSRLFYARQKLQALLKNEYESR